MKKFTWILLLAVVSCTDDELNWTEGLYVSPDWNYHIRIFDAVKNGNLFLVNPNYKLEDVSVKILFDTDTIYAKNLAKPWYWKNEPLLLKKYPDPWDLEIDYGNGDIDTLLIVHEPLEEDTIRRAVSVEKIIYYLNGKYQGEYSPPDGDWDYYFRRNGGWYYTYSDPNYALNSPDYDPIIFTLVKTDAIQ